MRAWASPRLLELLSAPKLTPPFLETPLSFLPFLFFFSGVDLGKNAGHSSDNAGGIGVLPVLDPPQRRQVTV